MRIGKITTMASESEIVNAHSMIDEITNDKSEILEKCKYLIGDKGLLF